MEERINKEIALEKEEENANQENQVVNDNQEVVLTKEQYQ